MNAEIEEKNTFLEKSQIISKFYEQLKIEVEEIKS